MIERLKTFEDLSNRIRGKRLSELAAVSSSRYPSLSSGFESGAIEVMYDW